MTAPWWGVPVIAGGFLVIGGALGFWFNWILEGRKQSRTEAIRWDADIRQYVAELIGLFEVLIKERGRRGAFTKGMAARLASDLGKATEAVIGRNQTSEPSDEMRKLIRDTVERGRAKNSYYVKSEKRTRHAWGQIYTLTASISLVAPKAICDAVGDLIETTSAALRFDDYEDVPGHGDQEGSSSAQPRHR